MCAGTSSGSGGNNEKTVEKEAPEVSVSTQLGSFAPCHVSSAALVRLADAEVLAACPLLLARKHPPGLLEMKMGIGNGSSVAAAGDADLNNNNNIDDDTVPVCGCCACGASASCMTAIAATPCHARMD